jgi:hypothetical protein
MYRTIEFSTPTHKVRGFSLAERLLAELQAAPGSRTIAKKLFADHAGFGAFLDEHGRSILAGVRALLEREAEAGRRAGHFRTWAAIGHAVNGTRCCRCCGKTKPETAFVKKGPRRIRFCKACDGDSYRRRYWARPAAYRASSRARAKTPQARERNSRKVALYRERHPERAKARTLVKDATRRGVLVRPDTCQVNGCTAPAIHGHHHDYGRPLDVTWLCREHHEHVHHLGPLPLKPGSKRKFARAPKTNTPQRVPRAARVDIPQASASI